MDHLATELIELVDHIAPQLERIAETDAGIKPSADDWSKKEIVGHLIDSAANNHHRFVRAQQAAELAFPAYEQEDWVLRQAYAASSWTHVVELWRYYNYHLAHLIRQIEPEHFETPCRVGAAEPVTLKYLVEDYLAHMKLHIKQLGL